MGDKAYNPDSLIPAFVVNLAITFRNRAGCNSGTVKGALSIVIKSAAMTEQRAFAKLNAIWVCLKLMRGLILTNSARYHCIYHRLCVLFIKNVRSRLEEKRLINAARATACNLYGPSLKTPRRLATFLQGFLEERKK
jgi:hypothetical protein